MDLIVFGFSVFDRLEVTELWVTFGRGNTLRYFPIHHLVNALRAEKAACMLFFDAFTGCDISLQYPWQREENRLAKFECVPRNLPYSRLSQHQWIASVMKL